MYLDYIHFAKKYKLDPNHVMTAMAVHSEVKRKIDRKISPYYLYDEDEALEAIMGYFCQRSSNAFHEYQEWEDQAKKLEKKLDKMGYYN